MQLTVSTPRWVAHARGHIWQGLLLCWCPSKDLGKEPALWMSILAREWGAGVETGHTFGNDVVCYVSSTRCSWRHGSRKILCRQLVTMGICGADDTGRTLVGDNRFVIFTDNIDTESLWKCSGLGSQTSVKGTYLGRCQLNGAVNLKSSSRIESFAIKELSIRTLPIFDVALHHAIVISNIFTSIHGCDDVYWYLPPWPQYAIYVESSP